MIKIGLIGAGKAAEAHVTELIELDGMTVDAVASRTGPSDFIGEFSLSAKAYTEPSELCNSAALDAVIICTPTYLHTHNIRSAVKNDLHILCEKPVVRTATELESASSEIMNTSSVFMPAHITRYMEPYLQLRKYIQKEKLGDLHSVTARRISTFPGWGSRNWFSDYDKSGGVFLDMGIHDLDFINWIVGDLDKVYASKVRGDPAEHGVVVGQCGNNVRINVEVSWAQPPTRPFTMEFEAVGSKGSVQYRQSHDGFKRDFSTPNNDSTKNSIEIWGEDQTDTIEFTDHNEWRLQLEEFRDSILGNTTPRTSIEESLQAVRIANAANKSVKNNEIVSVE